MENDFLPGDLECQIRSFVDRCSNLRYRESLDDLTPADVDHGRGKKLKMREQIKKQTLRKRGLQNQAAAAQTQSEIEPEPRLRSDPCLPEKLTTDTISPWRISNTPEAGF